MEKVSLYAEGPDDDYGTRAIELGASVKLVECRYKCGGWFVVTTMSRKLPSHFLCSLNASMACQKQMAARSGPYYDRWVQAMRDSADRWVAGCERARNRYANQDKADAQP